MVDQARAQTLPSIVRRERAPWGLWLRRAAGAIGGLWLAAWLFGVATKVALIGIAAGVGLFTLQSWRQRRVAVRVDPGGVREVFASGRERTYPWEDIEEVELLDDDAGCLHLADGFLVHFSPRLEDAPALTALIRAYWRGEPIGPLPDYPDPHPDEIAAALGVATEDLPVLLRTRRPAVEANLLLGGIGLGAIMALGEVVALALSLDWREVLGLSWIPALGIGVYGLGVGLYWLLRTRSPLVVEVGLQGIKRLGRREKFLPWSEMVAVEGRTIRGRLGRLDLPAELTLGDPLLGLVQRYLARRGPVPAAILLTPIAPSDAALSRTTSPEPEQATVRSLSRAEEVEEEQERLSEEVIEGKERLSGETAEGKVTVAVERER